MLHTLPCKAVSQLWLHHQSHWCCEAQQHLMRSMPTLLDMHAHLPFWLPVLDACRTVPLA